MSIPFLDKGLAEPPPPVFGQCPKFGSFFMAPLSYTKYHGDVIVSQRRDTLKTLKFLKN